MAKLPRWTITVKLKIAEGVEIKISRQAVNMTPQKVEDDE